MLKQISSASIALGVTVIGLLGVKEYLPSPWRAWLTDDLFTLAAVVSVGLIVVGAVFVAAGYVVERIEVATTKGMFHSVAKQSDLEDIRVLAQQLYQTQDVSSLQQMQVWLRKYPRAFFVVFTRTRRRFRSVEELKGYFCLLPVSQSAAQKLRAAEMTIQNLGCDDLLPSGFATVYLGGVAALGKVAQGACLSRLQIELELLAALQPQAEVITRPVTNDGMRLVRSYGFQPIGTATLSKGALASLALSDFVALRRSA